MVHVRPSYRIASLLGILATCVFVAACGGDASREQIDALRAELAELREGQEQLRKSIASLDESLSGRRSRAARAARDERRRKRAREVVRIIPTATSPTLGNAVAAAIVVQFVDFQSPDCKAAAGLPKALRDAHPKDVLVVFKNYPAATHLGGFLAAKAAWAAQRQGKFWEMHDLIFAGDIEHLTEDVLRGHAEQLGLDMARYEADATSAAAAQAIAADQAIARRFRVAGTPTYFVNGRLVPDGLPETVRRTVAEQVAERKQEAGS